MTDKRAKELAERASRTGFATVTVRADELRELLVVREAMKVALCGLLNVDVINACSVDAIPAAPTEAAE